MELVLWRHAEAEDGAPDEARRLTGRGVKQAERMAHWLRERLPRDARVLVSPAVRAQQTARALTRDYDTVPGLAPGASPAALLQAAGWPDGRALVVVVGHQPALGAAAALALTGRVEPWGVRKGALWWLHARDRGAVVRAVLCPELL